MKRPILAVVAVVLLLAVAATAWFLIGQGSSGAAKAATRASSAAVAPGDDARNAAAPEALGGVDANEVRHERVTLESAPKPAAVSTGGAAPAGKGTTVAGEVRDSAGQPIADAKVLARSIEQDWMMDSGPLDAAESWFGDQLGKLEATTDSKGRFEISGAKAGRLRVAVRAPHFAPLDANSLVVPSGEKHDIGTLTMDASPLLEVRVVDSRGRGVGGAELARRAAPTNDNFVFFSGDFGGPSVPLGKTRDDGSMTLDQLPIGPFRLAVHSEQHPDKSENVTTSKAGERLPGLTITLDEGASISGQVTGLPSVQTVELIVVAAPHRQGGADFGEEFVFGGGSDGRESKIGADGAFTVQGLRVDKQYDLTLRRKLVAGSDNPFAQRMSPKVVARAGERGVELMYQPESGMTFIVLDAVTKRPIEKYQASGGLSSYENFSRGDGDLHQEGRGRIGEMRPKSSASKARIEIKAVGYEPYEAQDIVLLEGRDVDLGMIELQPVPVLVVTVLDAATGAPVGGARVSLRKEPKPDGGMFGGGAFEAAHASGRSIAISTDSGGADFEADDPGFDFGGGDSQSGKTDANGVVSLNSFAGERCQLVVKHRGHAPHLSESFVGAGGVGEAREVRLNEGGSVRVTLVRADGSPIAGGKVEHRAAPTADATPMTMFAGNDSSVTDAAGQAVFTHLAAGAHEFRPDGYESNNGMFGGGNFRIAIAGAPDEGAKGWEAVAVSEGAEAALKLIAPTRVVLNGVIREGGEALAGATVSLREKSAEEMPRMMFLGSGGPEAQSDGRGRYALENVRSGDYTLTVSHPSRQMPAEFELSVGAQDMSYDVNLGVAIVEGRVTGSDGKPLAGVKVTIEPHQAGGSRRVSMIRMVMDNGDEEATVLDGMPGATKPVRTDDDGRYALRGVSVERELVVKAEAKDLRPAKSEPFTMHDNEVKRGVDLRLERAGRIEVTAFKADGTPASMVMITARLEGDADAEPQSGFIQQNGKTKLDSLAPGRWKVTAQSMDSTGPGAPRPAPLEQTVEVKADEATPVRFDLP